MITAASSDIGRYIEPVARALLGDPNPHLSTKTELRYGQHGSMSINLDKGIYYNHEEKNGGGVLDLIKRETGRSGTDAMRHLEEIVGNGSALPQSNGRAGKAKTRGQLVGTFNYIDEAGELLFQVLKYAEPKDFLQRRPEGNG